MSTVNQDELKAIKVLEFEGKESEWDRWSETFIALARARGFAGILLGTEQAPNADEDIERKKADGSYELTDAERKEKKRLRQANGNAYINLQMSCEDLPYDLVSLAKSEELTDGCARDAWERLTSEYDLTEGEDKITLLTMFQQNQLEDVRTKITKVNLPRYVITHILASLPREYSSVVEQVKIDRRTSSTLITMDEVKKRLKERYLQLKKEHGWSEDEMALSMKSGNDQTKNIKKGSKGKYFKGRCNHCGNFGHKKADCWDLKNKKEKHQENEKKVQKDKSKVRCFKCGKLGHYANECKNDKESSGGGNNETFAMTCFEDEEDDKNENGDDENKFEGKNSEDNERKVGPGTPRNTKEPQRTPPTQTNVFMTQVTNEWAMSTIENNSATPRDLSSVRAWMESSKYGEYEKSRNMINVPLAREKSTLKDGCNNAQRTGQNVARAQPNLSYEEDEIQNSNFEHVPRKRPSDEPEEDDRKPAAKRIKKEPEDDAQSVTQDEPELETVVKPWEDKKDYEAIFRKHIYIGNYGEEHYDVIDMEIDAQRAVRRITDHQEIVKQYQKVVRAYNNYMRDHPWMTEGLMQDNCRFGDLLKDEKRKSQLKYELGRLMGEYAVPLPLGNFNLSNKETRRLELWKNRRGMWFDHVEHMEESPEQNKEWENFWWTVDEDMFTYVMKTKIEELIEEKLNQEFPEEVEIREDPDYDSEEEMTSETEDTDDDESETNNANVNNYLDSANVVTNLETVMKIAEEEDLWIGDSGASSHMMGSEEHVFNKRLITGSVRTANGAHMKMLCEGDINVDVITKDGDVTSGTLRVKVIPAMKQKLFSFTQAMMGGWSMQGGQTKQGELFIALTHEDHKPIIFDRVLKAGNSVLLAAKMVIKNPKEVNAAIVNGKQSKEYFHRVTGHAGHHLMDATAKSYKVDLTGKVNNCLSCSLEKIRQKNIPKKNEDKSKNPGERMYLDISSMRKPSMGGRQHWVMLVDEATKYKKSFFLKKKNEQVEPIIDWIKALKARHKIQVKIIRCDNAGENKVLERESDKNELGIIFEYTAPGTPHQNGVVERAFVTVMGRARAMMNHAGFTMAKRQQLWCEAAQTATMLDNILVQESAKSPPFTQFFGVDAKYAKHLRVFGEMCVVADTDNKVGRTKIDPRGKISLFVGYSTQHAGDVYRLLNPKTSRVIHSRDVKWIGKTWAEFYKIKMIDRASGHVDPDEDLLLEEDEDQDVQEEEIEPEEDEQEVIQVGQSQAEEPTETPVGEASDEPVASRTRSQTTASEPVAARTRQALGTRPEMSAFADVKDDKTLNEWLHEIAFVTSTMSDPDEPQSFQEAWWDPDLISREKWREAIRLEFKKMLDMGVWRHVKRNDRPNDRRLVGCRWVFKVKRNGVYRARLVAKGFSQIPGVDFTDNYSPVVNDVTFRTVVARMIIENMKGKVVDIDNAFLNGDLEHEIYMKIPEGYDEVINPGVDKEDCLILQKAIYGLVQAARQFWKKIVDKMQEGGFKLSEADPCMLYKEDENGVCIIIIYIDDMLIIGKEEAIDDAIKVLQGHFQVKDPTSLEDYLGVQIVQSDDGKKAWLGQPTIIKSLEKQFGERVAKKKMTVTPGTPGFIGGKVDDISNVDEKTQSMYRSGVGTLLYLTKHSRPDITNPVRELSKSMDGASMAQVTEMYRVINFVLETKTLG